MNENRIPSADAATAIEIWSKGVEAAGAEAVVGKTIDLTGRYLTIAGQAYEIERLKRIIVVGFGKCSGAMAEGFESALKAFSGIELSGLVIVPAGQSASTSRIETVVGRSRADNFPTTMVVQQTQRMIDMITGAGEETLIVAMVSGGGSALLERPLVPLEELIAVSRALSHAGAPIESLNTVRRAISGIKAGGLARHVIEHSNANMLGLIISDVIGDDLRMVASGPTVISEDSAAALRSDAREVLLRFHLQSKHDSVFRWLEDEAAAEAPIKSGQRIKNVLIANNATAVEAAMGKARQLNFEVVSTACVNVNQDVNEVADDWVDLVTRTIRVATAKPTGANLADGSRANASRANASRANSSRADGAQANTSRAIIAGGEPTVVLCDDPGRGGRNLQLAALVLQKLLNPAVSLPVEAMRIVFVSGGTDGEDGSAAVAGALFDTETLCRLSKSPSLQRSLQKAIMENDCEDFFARHGSHVAAPQVLTNVCDLQVMLVSRLDEET